jgi:membrane protein DedA with SNARE-associated domain
VLLHSLHPLSPQIGALIAQHGYLFAFVGTLFEGEMVLVLGGIAAHGHLLHFGPLLLVGAAGGFLGDQIYFFVGRRWGLRLVTRFAALHKAADRVTAMVDRHPALTVIGVRFLYGLRTAGPLAIGMSKVHWLTFAVANAIGACVWSVTWVVLGSAAGEAMQRVLGRMQRIEHWVLAAALIVALGAWIAHRIREAARARASTPSSRRRANAALHRAK